MGALSLTGDVIAGGAALAGLILVYLGNVATIFGIYEKTQQHAVRKIINAERGLRSLGCH